MSQTLPPKRQHERRDVKPTHRKGPSTRRKAPQRQCLVTRTVGDTRGLIRFVVSPDGEVIPDLKANLPGRGVWITANRQVVDEAVRRRLFPKGFRTGVRVAEDLALRVDRQLTSHALGSLGLARKAGQVVSGFAKVEARLRDRRVALLLSATDGSPDSKSKLHRIAANVPEPKVEVVELLTSEEMSLALGQGNVIHVGVHVGDDAENVGKRLRRLAAYRGEPPDPAQGVVETMGGRTIPPPVRAVDERLSTPRLALIGN